MTKIEETIQDFQEATGRKVAKAIPLTSIMMVREESTSWRIADHSARGIFHGGNPSGTYLQCKQGRADFNGTEYDEVGLHHGLPCHGLPSALLVLEPVALD